MDKPEDREKPDTMMFHDIPEPIANRILKAVEDGRITQCMTPNGAYYHYVDVVRLLSDFEKSHVIPDRERIKELEKEIITLKEHFQFLKEIGK